MSATFLVDLQNTAFNAYTYVGTIATDTTTKGSAVDMLSADGNVHLLGIVGNYGDLVTQAVVKLQESDTTTDADFADITGATTTLAASATANDNSVLLIRTHLRSKRYVRGVVVTTGGGTVSIPIALAVLSRKKITGTGGGTQL